jgi:5-methylthioadenosine/S-adenosylhomocysteine deaminase
MADDSPGTVPRASMTFVQDPPRMWTVLSCVGTAVWLSLLFISAAHAQWQADKGLVLAGTVVTMNDAADVLPVARVFLRDGLIAAVARDGEGLPPEAADAVVVTTDSFIYPGLIDLHNHPEYSVFPLWVVPDLYRDRYQWRGRRAYKAAVAEPYKMLSAREYLNLQAELGKYAELKAIVGGTTAIQGMDRHKAYSSVEYLVRNVEYTEVGAQPVKRMLDPPRTPAGWPDAKRAALGSGAWFFHLAEGLASSPRTGQEFDILRAEGLLLPQLVAIHSVGVKADDLRELGSIKAKIVWSPLSNLLLYAQTADVKTAKGSGVLLSLAPDWSPTGSKSILGELKVADVLNRTRLGDLFSDSELVAMVTRNPARALGWGAVAGQIAPGFIGDVVVVDKLDSSPFRSLIRATETHIQLVVIRGEPLYGDAEMMRSVKTYREPIPSGGTKLTRKYELLSLRLPGQRQKAVDFKRTGIEKGDLAAKDMMETLEKAMKFGRRDLRRRIAAPQSPRISGSAGTLRSPLPRPTPRISSASCGVSFLGGWPLPHSTLSLL